MILLIGLVISIIVSVQADDKKFDEKTLTTAQVLEQAAPSDWRPVYDANTLYMELPMGRVIMELLPEFAPNHVQNIQALAQENYWDGLAIVRTQDNYVVQWGDPNAENLELQRKIKKAQRTLSAEFEVPLNKSLKFTALQDADVYAQHVGFYKGFPIAWDQNKMWMIHCYGAVGVGRDKARDSGGGAELYVVIGHSPRHLDRNVTLVGRVLRGQELLSSLPRGTGALGFYEKPEQRVAIQSLRRGSDVPKKERLRFEVLRTDTETFRHLIKARRSRSEEWFQYKANRLEVCNVAVPVRLHP